MADARILLAEALEVADVRLDGDRPWDLKIKDERACARILRYQNLGLGESYMDGWVECGAIDQLIDRVLRSPLAERVRGNWRLLPYALQGVLTNLGAKARAFQVGERHYDIGNDLFERMLDRRLTYTCGYWNGAKTLDEAQEAKLDLTCRKIGLVKGMTVLDIGCGWGSFIGYAAERYGVKAVGLTVSKEQAAYVTERYGSLPIEVRLEDYREVSGKYDRVVSLGMFEHVGWKNYRTFMEVADRSLEPGGLFLLHTIGGNRSGTSTEPWYGKYIFPNSHIPSIAQIARAAEGLFVMEDWHDFGACYDTTLMAWYANCEAAWKDLPRYDERFRRMWRYYLLLSAGSFRARYNQLWQTVFSKGGVPGGYRSIR